MNTVIVPVDYSDTSFNAATYAANLLAGHDDIEMILYHMYEDEYGDVNSIENLENLKKDLLKIGNLNISIHVEKGEDFAEEFDKLARHRRADLVIMGITEKAEKEKKYTESNALKIAENKYYPVLIVPPTCRCKGMNNVLLATDLKNVETTTPSAQIKNVIKHFKPNLHILNVNDEHYISLTEENEAEKQKLAVMFNEYNPEFYFLRLYNIDEAIEVFANDKNIDLIISIHKDHSAISRLFLGSHTRNLAQKGQVAILSVHE